MNNTINKILKYSIFAGLCIIPFIPLYVANSMFFPFITGKAVAFRIIVEIIFAIWLILVLRERGNSVSGTSKSVAPRVNMVTISVTVFTVIALIADLFGVNPLRSIWSNFERMEGWVIISHLWAYFIVLSSVIRSSIEDNDWKINWNTFLNVALIAGTITAIYGLFQFFGWAETHQGATRVDASLGNSAYMAVFMLINAFLAAYMAVVNFSKSKKIWMYVYSVLAVFFSFILFQTGTRGTMLAWIGAVVLACLIYSIWGREKNGQSNKSRMIAGGAILLVVILSVLFYFNRSANWIQTDPVLNRLASISIKDTKNQARGYVWPMALKGTFESPKKAIIGWGQENFNYVFNKYYNPKMWSQEQWFDRAHSVFLDWLVAGGLLGLISYLFLFIVAIVYIVKSNITIGQKSILVSLLAGYAVHNIFVFDNQTSYVMFFTVLAFIQTFRDGKVYGFFKGNEKGNKENAETMLNYVYIPVVIILFAVTFYFVNVRTIQANTRLITALRSCSGSSGTPSTATFEDALAPGAYTANQEIREQLLSCTVSVIRSGLSDQDKQAFYNLAKAEVEKQIASAPNDARTYILAGASFSNFGDMTTALPYIEKAHELSPAKQTIALELVNTYLNIGKLKEAVDVAKTAYESAPDFYDVKIAYIASLIYNNQEADAKKEFASQPEVFFDDRIANVYVVKGEIAKAIVIYKKAIEANPNNQQVYPLLAVAYLKNKQNTLAIETLKIAKDKFPEIATQVDQVIKDIQAGKNILQ